jgi:hypothetical protein
MTKRSSWSSSYKKYRDQGLEIVALDFEQPE